MKNTPSRRTDNAVSFKQKRTARGQGRLDVILREALILAGRADLARVLDGH